MKTDNRILNSLPGSRFLSLATALFLSNGNVVAQTNGTQVESSESGGAQRVIVKEPKRLDSPNMILKKGVFDPDVHVYYTEKPGIPLAVNENQRAEIAKSLSGTSYYLFIVEDCNNFGGRERVANLLGQDLYNSQEFGKLKFNLNGREIKKASTLLLSLNPRGWEFNASPLHEEFGVRDEAVWASGPQIGLRAREHFAARRYSRGVEDAVTQLDRLLNNNLDKIVSSANLAISESSTLVAQYTSALTAANLKYTGRSGDLFKPADLEQIQFRLKAGKDALSKNDYQMATEIGTAIRENLKHRLKALLEYEGAGYRIERMSKSLEAVKVDGFNFMVSDDLRDAQLALSRVKTLWEKGESEYATALTSSDELIQNLSLSLEKATKNYSLDGERIIELRKRHKQLSGSKYASDAQKDLELADNSLTRAKSLWIDKNSAYPQILKQANDQVNDAARIIDDRISAEKTSKLMKGLGALFAAAGLALAGSLGWRTSRKVKAEKERAQSTLASLKEAMKIKEEGLEALERLKEKALTADGEPLIFSAKSESDKLARSAKIAIQKLWVFQIVANDEVVTQAEAAIAKGGILSSKNYAHALEIMSDRPVSFSKDNRDKVKEAFGLLKTGASALAVPLEELSDFSRSMQEMDQEVIRLSEEATTALEKLITANSSMTALRTNFNSKLETLVQKADSLKATTSSEQFPGIFSAAGLNEDLIKPLGSFVEGLKDEIKNDPVKAQAEFAIAQAICDKALELSESALNFRSSGLPIIAALTATLGSKNIDAKWIDSELTGISSTLENLFKELANSLNNSTEVQISKFEKDFAELKTRINSTAGLLNNLVNLENNALPEVVSQIAAARKQISEKLYIEISDTLSEEEANPDLRIQNCKNSISSTSSLIASGDLESADEALKQAGSELEAARNIVVNSLEVLNVFEANRAAGIKLAQELLDAKTDHSVILSSLKSDYSDQNLILGSTEKQSEAADNTVNNNIAEAESGIEAGMLAIAEANSDFEAGDLLSAWSKLAQAKAELNSVRLRYLELSEKNELMLKTDAENQTDFKAAQQIFTELSLEIKDKKVSQAVIDKLNAEIKNKLEEIQNSLEAKGRNPLVIAEDLDKLLAALKATTRTIAQQRENHAEAKRSIVDAQSKIVQAITLSESAEKDDVPDSPQTDQAQSQLLDIKKSIDSLSKRFESAEHQDWDSFNEEADNLELAIKHQSSAINSETDKGKKVIQSIKAAVEAVGAAANFQGRYGVDISGNPGSGDLASAREHFRNGNYENAANQLSRAITKAREAVKEAEEEIRREQRQREEAERARRRAEEERREDEARARRASERARESSRSSSSWGSSSGGSNISFGGGSSSGGTNVSW